MVVVAIIGILAAVAIPQYLNYIHRVTRAENIIGLKSIAVAQESYWANHDHYLTHMWVAFEGNGNANFYTDRIVQGLGLDLTIFRPGAQPDFFLSNGYMIGIWDCEETGGDCNNVFGFDYLVTVSKDFDQDGYDDRMFLMRNFLGQSTHTGSDNVVYLHNDDITNQP